MRITPLGNRDIVEAEVSMLPLDFTIMEGNMQRHHYHEVLRDANRTILNLTISIAMEDIQEFTKSESDDITNLTLFKSNFYKQLNHLEKNDIYFLEPWRYDVANMLHNIGYQ